MSLHSLRACIAQVAVLIFVMMLISVFLGFLSGALVEDINSLYDEVRDSAK